MPLCSRPYLGSAARFTCSKTRASTCHARACARPWRRTCGRVFNAPHAEDARRLLERFLRAWEAKTPKLTAWAASAVPEGFAVFALPATHRPRLRTSNALERLNKELKRRTRVATLFPSAASCERLASAVAMEISEEWVSGRAYLNMDVEDKIQRQRRVTNLQTGWCFIK